MQNATRAGSKEGRLFSQAMSLLSKASSYFMPQHSGQVQFSVGTKCKLTFFPSTPEFKHSTCGWVLGISTLMCTKLNIGT